MHSPPLRAILMSLQALAPLICEFDSNAEPIERPSDTDSNPFSLIGEVHLMKKGLPSDDVEGWCSIPIQTDKLEWLTSLLKADSVTLRASFNWGGVDGRAEVLCWSGFHLFVTRPKGSTTSSIQIALTGIESYVGPIAPAGLQQFCHILASNGADVGALASLANNADFFAVPVHRYLENRLASRGSQTTSWPGQQANPPRPRNALYQATDN